MEGKSGRSKSLVFQQPARAGQAPPPPVPERGGAQKRLQPSGLMPHDESHAGSQAVGSPQTKQLDSKKTWAAAELHSPTRNNTIFVVAFILPSPFLDRI